MCIRDSSKTVTETVCDCIAPITRTGMPRRDKRPWLRQWRFQRQSGGCIPSPLRGLGKIQVIASKHFQKPAMSFATIPFLKARIIRHEKAPAVYSRRGFLVSGNDRLILSQHQHCGAWSQALICTHLCGCNPQDAVFHPFLMYTISMSRLSPHGYSRRDSGHRWRAP